MEATLGSSASKRPARGAAAAAPEFSAAPATPGAAGDPRTLPEATALYAEYCARAGGRGLLTPSLFDLQVLVETRVGQEIDEAFWRRMLAAPDHLLPNTRRLLVDVAG